MVALQGLDLSVDAGELLAAVGLGQRLHHRPGQLSAGEQQRVALAVALANRPPVLLADEPTGQLDSETGREVASLVRGLPGGGTTVVMATHDRSLAALADRVVTIEDGRLAG